MGPPFGLELPSELFVTNKKLHEGSTTGCPGDVPVGNDDPEIRLSVPAESIENAKDATRKSVGDKRNLFPQAIGLPSELAVSP